MKKISVVTATRAEFGLLLPVIRELRKFESKQLKVELIVTGTHLVDAYGKTINEIIEYGVRIDYTVLVCVESDTACQISRNQADTLVKFTEIFEQQKYDGVVLLGDRYETLAIAIAAGNTHTPIFHLCGGDTTEGAIDEWIRHSITKMSYLHFPTNEESRSRIIQMGENPERVFNYGSTSIDNILEAATLSRDEALESVGLDSGVKYALCTYHPVTMGSQDVDTEMQQFLAAIKRFPELEFIVTKSNADQGGAKINQILDDAENEIANLHVYSSLGIKRYLSLMKYAEFVLGNSSSGIIETPAFHIPTVNIGDRQQGRLHVSSIIDCETSKDAIEDAINKAMAKEFQQICQQAVCPYGDGHAAEKIASKIVETIVDGQIDIKKKFYWVKKDETYCNNSCT